MQKRTEGAIATKKDGVVRVSEYVNRVGDVDTRRKNAEIDGINTDTKLRKWMALSLTALFLVLNGAVVWLIWRSAQIDLQMIAAGTIKPAERLITEKVYMSLIGGTVLQVAAIVLAIARYLFPTNKRT